MIKTEPNLTKISKGFRAYKIKGVSETIVARKGGPSAEQIKTKPTYKALRNNQKEFGVASMMSKVLRQSFSENMSAICETYSSGKLTARFRNLAKLEEGQTGTRPMIPSKHGHELNGFEFNNKAPYKKIFGAKYFVKGGSRSGQVILHYPSFIPMEVFDAPAEATNFKINARLVAISDYQYDVKSDSYRPTAEGANGSFGTYESNMLPLLKMPTEPMTGQVSIPVSELEEGVGTFLIMAVSFFRYESGHFIHLPAHSGMQIHEVY